MNATVRQGLQQTKERLLQLQDSLKQVQRQQQDEWNEKSFEQQRQSDSVLVCLGLDYWVQVNFARGQQVIERKLERIQLSLTQLEAYMETPKNEADNILTPIDTETMDIREPILENDHDLNVPRKPHQPTFTATVPLREQECINSEKAADLAKLNAICEQFLVEEEQLADCHVDLEHKLRNYERVLLTEKIEEAESLDDPNFHKELIRDVHKAYLQKRFQRRALESTGKSSDRRVRFSLPNECEEDQISTDEKWLRELNQQLRESLDLSESYPDVLSDDQYPDDFQDDE